MPCRTNTLALKLVTRPNPGFAKLASCMASLSIMEKRISIRVGARTQCYLTPLLMGEGLIYNFVNMNSASHTFVGSYEHIKQDWRTTFSRRVKSAFRFT